MIKQGLEACLQSQSSTQKISCRNGILVCNGDNNYRRCSRDIQMQKNDNALLINGDAKGFVRPHRDCTMVMDSLQFNNMSRLKTVSFSCELNTPQENGSTANNLKLVIDYCADNGSQEAWPRARPTYDNDAVFCTAYPVLDQE